jgi:hypothetical protein
MQIEVKPGQFQKLLRKFVHGGREASEAVAKAAMKQLAEERTRQFKERVAWRQEVNKHYKIINAPLAELLRKDQKAVQSMREKRKVLTRISKRKMKFPTVAAEKPRIITGSIGGVVVPPCYAPYVEQNTSANPACGPYANALNGQIGFDLHSDPNNYSVASVTCAVGMFYYPVSNGALTIQAYPTFNGQWGYTTWLQGGETTAWIGLCIEQLDPNNNFQTQLYFTQNWIWNEQFSGIDDNNGAIGISDNNGVVSISMQNINLAAGCNVDVNHHYLIYVQCGGTISGGDYGDLFGSSDCYSGLYVTVPSIIWTQY